MSYYVAPIAVVSGPVILRYAIRDEPSPEVPFELRPFYTQDVWGPRISAVRRTAARYSKRTLEWVWLVGTLAALIAAPIAVYYIVLNSIPAPPAPPPADDNRFDRGFDADQSAGFDRFWKARLASAGTFCGVALLAFVPMRVWKSRGKRAVDRMLRQYEAQDRAARGGSAPVPSLRMKTPGVVSRHIKLLATIPPPPPPSLYQPGANIPPYLANPPADAWRRPGQAQGWGAPPNELPLYDPNEERVPGYDGAPLAYSEEKHANPFEDVQV